MKINGALILKLNSCFSNNKNHLNLINLLPLWMTMLLYSTGLLQLVIIACLGLEVAE